MRSLYFVLKRLGRTRWILLRKREYTRSVVVLPMYCVLYYICTGGPHTRCFRKFSCTYVHTVRSRAYRVQTDRLCAAPSARENPLLTPFPYLFHSKLVWHHRKRLLPSPISWRNQAMGGLCSPCVCVSACVCVEEEERTQNRFPLPPPSSLRPLLTQASDIALR